MNINEMVGKIFTGIEVDKKNDIIQFNCTNGVGYRFYHEQDCCESVTIEDVNGDIEDLVNTTLLVAEENTNNEVSDEYSESHTWTFYKFGTVKGYVDIRWHGTSNGYYSESVNMKKVLLDEKDELTIHEVEFNVDISSKFSEVTTEYDAERNNRVFKYNRFLLKCYKSFLRSTWEFEIYDDNSGASIEPITITELLEFIKKYESKV